jgi:hypothetical protein
VNDLDYWQDVIKLVMICSGLFVIAIGVLWFIGMALYSIFIVTITEEIEYRKYLKSNR